MTHPGTPLPWTVFEVPRYSTEDDGTVVADHADVTAFAIKATYMKQWPGDDVPLRTTTFISTINVGGRDFEEAKKNAAYIVQSANLHPRLVEALRDNQYALRTMLELVKAHPDFQGREHIGTGIRVHDALAASRALLSEIDGSAKG